MGKKDENLTKFEKCSGSNVPRFITFPLSICALPVNAIIDTIDFKFMQKYRSKLSKDSLFSVRSSGSVSTPGRMETVLNVSESTLEKALTKVYNSSKSTKLKNYLELKEIKDFEVNIIIQEMVHGDKTHNSCSGVLLTENPFVNFDVLCNLYTGRGSYPYIEYVPHSTGDKLMSGIQTPKNDLASFNKEGMTKLYEQIELISKKFPYICEVEFVIQDKEAYILQIREYKNNSSVHIVNTSGLRVETIGFGKTVIHHACKGRVTFDKTKVNSESIYITDETDWEDTKMLLECAGVITRNGGRLSHAALISKEFYVPCVVGAQFDEEPKEGQLLLFTGGGEICKVLNDKMDFKITR